MVAEVKDLHSNNADIERMQQIFAAQKAAYRQHPYPSAEQRIELINRIKPCCWTTWMPGSRPSTTISPPAPLTKPSWPKC